MKQIRITFSKNISRTALFNTKSTVIEALTAVGLTLEPSIILKSSPADYTKYRMVKSFLVDVFGDQVDVQLVDRPFNFEDHINTDLDGSTICTDAQEMLLSFDTLIEKTIPNATTEYKKQARQEIGRLVKDNVDRWIELNGEIEQ